MSAYLIYRKTRNLPNPNKYADATIKTDTYKHITVVSGKNELAFVIIKTGADWTIKKGTIWREPTSTLC